MRYSEDGRTRVPDTETPVSDQIESLAHAVNTELQWIAEHVREGRMGTFAALQQLQDAVDYLQRETNLIAEAVDAVSRDEYAEVASKVAWARFVR